MVLRFQIVAPVLLVGVLVVGGSLYFAQRPRPATTTNSPSDANQPAAPAALSPPMATAEVVAPMPSVSEPAEVVQVPVASPIHRQSELAGNVRPAGLTNPPTAAERQTRIRAEINQLRELAMEADAESLEKITAALADPELAIRAEAIDAAVQFGSRDAIAALQELAARSTDAREKVAVLEAIEMLGTPPLDELRTKLRARRAALGTNAPGVMPQP